MKSEVPFFWTGSTGSTGLKKRFSRPFDAARSVCTQGENHEKEERKTAAFGLNGRINQERVALVFGIFAKFGDQASIGSVTFRPTAEARFF